jgi:hypothetical protein
LVLILISCQTTQNQNLKKIKPISIDYYTVKSPEEKDLEYLDKFIDNNSEYKEDALILKAGYFVKTHDYKKSYDIFKNNPNLKTNNRVLNEYLYVWKVKSFLENGDEPFATDMDKLNVTEIKRFCENLLYKKLLGKYCNDNVSMKENDNLKVADNLTDNVSEQIMVNSDNKILNIYIPEEFFNRSLTRGMIFSINENKVNVEIQSEYTEESNSIKIDFDKYILKMDNVSFSFGYDFNNNIYEIISLIWNQNPDLVVIGMGKENYLDVNILKNELESLGITCIAVNYLEKNIQARLETINDEYGNNSIFYVGIGTEDEMIKYVPIVKFASKHTDKIDIAVITDAFTDKFFNKEIKQYFYNVYVITYIEAVRDFWSKSFENQYKGFYGEEPYSESFIGYDMILKLFNMDKVFVSNIKGFDNNIAKRDIKFFKILRYNQVEVLKVPNFFN